MCSMRIPSFPVAQCIESCEGSPRMGFQGKAKATTMHQVNLYNAAAFLANASLMATAVAVVATVLSHFHPILGVFALFSGWIHVSAARYCKELTTKNSDPSTSSQFGFNPSVTKSWDSTSSLCSTAIVWHNSLPTVTQGEFNALPKSIDALVSKCTGMRGWRMIKQIESIWHGIHEGNRPYLRTFFNQKSGEFSGGSHDRQLANLWLKCMMDVPSQVFFAEERTHSEIQTFLQQRAAMPDARGPIPEVD
jgi:hypothetical protein